MPMTLNHTIVPSKDKVASAQFFARIMGLPFEGATGNFAPVRINETLTMDFDDRRPVSESHHYAFKVSDEEFDAILARVKEAGITYGSEPTSKTDMQINHRRGGRGFYFPDPNGHSLEVLTHD